ncbi:hypothetical protein RintRC_6849 [Richelia intracellularis]|nr:hypothetical protein RintRC_6849 [Richelia intracellularis]
MPLIKVSPLANNNPCFGFIVTKTLVVLPHSFKVIYCIPLP